MRIKKVNTKIDFIAAEHDVLEYWKENDQFIIQAYKDLIKIQHRLVDWQDEVDQIGHDVTYHNPRYQ